MAQIDSGLGWSCDSDYYVSDANAYIGTDRQGNVYTKTNTGAAIIGKMHWVRDNRMNVIIISTVQDNSAITMIDSDVYQGSYAVSGVIWYVYTMSWDNLNTDPNPDIKWITDEPFPTYPAGNYSENISALLTAANFQFTTPSKDIPSVNYVHKYVEGVLKEMPGLTADQLNALRALI